METLLGRYKNLIVLAAILFAQLIALAVRSPLSKLRDAIDEVMIVLLALASGNCERLATRLSRKLGRLKRRVPKS